MTDILAWTDVPFWIAITLICVVPGVAHYWWKIRRAELEADLKHEMLARGMSADDITRVLNASAADSDDSKKE